MNDLQTSLPFAGYGVAAVVYLALTLFVVLRHKRRLLGGVLTVALLSTAFWAAFHSYASFSQKLWPLATFTVEISLNGIWLLYLSALFSGARGVAQHPMLRYGALLLTLAILVIGLAMEIYADYNAAAAGAGSLLVLGSLLTALVALVLAEQIYRNAREAQRRSLKFLCLGVSGLFVFDVFMYSNAVLEGQISELFWGTRGYVVALCAPLIAIAVVRSPSLSTGMFVSRQVAFYTATLFGAGAYLVTAGIAGYYIRAFGGNVGQAVQFVFFAAAALVLIVLLVSDSVRARLRVFISKHFYENKYDYRVEWLRLIETLTAVSDAMPLKKRAIKALAQVLQSPSGTLWTFSAQDGTYRCIAGWNTECSNLTVPGSDALVQFLESTGWIIDIEQYRKDSSVYDDVTFDVDCLGTPRPGYVVPLLDSGRLFGFVALAQIAKARELNYEDLDLLKTAGYQVASYLAQEAATEQLAEGRQFEAFNKLTAYLMHDLKNVIAQQSLVVENAQKHKDNPLFIDDAIETIKRSVARMRKIIEQLQQSSPEQHLERVELGKVIIQAVSQCADRKPEPRALIGEEAIWVRADRERLLMAVSHAVRNAQDATAADDGEVSVRLRLEEDTAEIEIADNGQGMDAAFVRERLFRPFDSTKGSQGMGIGAYQIRETLKALGGDVSVTSEPGSGTRFVLTIKTV